MTVPNLALQILTAGNTPVPEKVATALISAVDAEQLPNCLLNAGTFGGDDAVAVARSDRRRARLIAANTRDAAIQRALFESIGIQVEALKGMFSGRVVTDDALLIDVHRLVCEDRHLASEYSDAREQVVRLVPLAYQLEYLSTLDPARRYPCQPVACRIGQCLASGATYPLAYIAAICSRWDGHRDTRDRDEFLESIGRSYALGAKTAPMADMLARVVDEVPAPYHQPIIRAAFGVATLVDAPLLRLLLAAIETPEEFAESQQRTIESMYTGMVPQAPYVLQRHRGAFTLDALELLVATFPGALTGLVESLERNDEHLGAIVDLALGTGRVDVARALLDHADRGNSEHPIPLFDAAQFHQAIEVYRNGTFIEKPTREKPSLNAPSVLANIPSGADVDDIIAVLDIVEHSALVVEGLVCTLRRKTPQYHITAPVLASLLQHLDQTDRIKIIHAMLHEWRFMTTNVADGPSPEFSELLTCAVDQIEASELCTQSEGPRYIAHRLADALGDNPERWLHTLGLLPSARVGLSRVIGAGARL